jgi:hypothetical protein
MKSMVLRVAARSMEAMEHATEEARKKYLQDHPNAKPSNHKVKKTQGRAKKDGEAVDNPPEAAAAKAKTREAETAKHFEDIKGLKVKYERGDAGAKKKVNTLYGKIFDNGEKAVKEAEKVISEYEDQVEEDSEAFDCLTMLDKAIRDWKSNLVDHHKKTTYFGEGFFEQAASSESYAKSVDKWIQATNSALKGEEVHVD